MSLLVDFGVGAGGDGKPVRRAASDAKDIYMHTPVTGIPLDRRRRSRRKPPENAAKGRDYYQYWRPPAFAGTGPQGKRPQINLDAVAQASKALFERRNQILQARARNTGADR